MIGTGFFPRQLVAGGGALSNLPAVLRNIRNTSNRLVANPLIVTDPFLKSTGVADRVASLIKGANLSCKIHHETIPDPTTDSVQQVVDAILQGDHDCVVALGGGSPIDTAKAACVLSVTGGEMSTYKAPFQMDSPVVPLVAIPTTAGTGSEVTRFTIISDSKTGEKMLCIGSSYVPVAAVVDYELTLTCPYRLTADTAIDALTHAIEAYVSRKHSVLSDRYALNSMKTVNKYIREACNNPSSTTAREQLMIAATEGGMAFSISSVAMVHGMSRPLGAVFHVPHGLSNAMLLPDVTRFGIETNPERYAQCAAAMGFASDSASVDNAATALLEGLEQMCHDLKVPSLSQFGVNESQYRTAINRMVSEAQASGSPGNNPRIPTDAEMARVYNVVYR